VVNAALRYGAAVLLAIAAAAAPLASRAGVGLMQLPGVASDGPVTVFYPTASAGRPILRGPFTIRAAENATPVRGNGRLIVVSHGSGGTPWVHSDLARALVDAGFTVAFPEHHEDNGRDPSRPGPESWKRRPLEVSSAIDAVGRWPQLANLLALDRVGMYGMSAGGHTALSLAGGRWSAAGVRRHCEAHIAEDFNSCAGLATQLHGDMLDGLKMQATLAVFRLFVRDDTPQAHHDPRIAAIVAGVPYAADFDMASLAQPRVPLGLVTSGLDKWLVPRFHSDRVLAACRAHCELIAHLPSGGHAALLSPPPPPSVLGRVAADLLADPPGFDRAELPAVDQKIVAFFRARLLP
jgi:predicted dienelactone hydrolase